MPEQEQYITYSNIVSELVIGERTPGPTYFLKYK